VKWLMSTINEGEKPKIKQCRQHLGSFGSTKLVLIIEAPDQHIGEDIARDTCRSQLSKSRVVVVVLCRVNMIVDYCN